MIKVNKLFASFILFVFIFTHSFKLRAEEISDYSQMSVGDCATENGFFFTESGMIKLATNVDEKLKLSNVQKETEKKLCILNLESCTKTKEAELKIQKEMYEEQLKIKQRSLDSLNNQLFWDNFKLVGGIIGGLAAGFLVGKLFIKN